MLIQKNVNIVFNSDPTFLKQEKLIFQLFGPYATLHGLCFLHSWFFFNSSKKKLVILEKTNSLLKFTKALNKFFYIVCRFFFLEVFVTGKGYRFARSRRGACKGFSLFVGVRCVYLILPPKDCFVVGLNKKKIVLCSTKQGALMNYARVIQLLKFPTKYYMQGLNLRFKVRKLQNFRHKKRK